jgi:flagellar biosynthesis/type III secretory pathway M-ring protein FliF/YscJ
MALLMTVRRSSSGIIINGLVTGVIVIVIVIMVVVLMPVVPQLGLVQQEEKHQADEQRHEQIFGPGLALKRFRQQVHEGRGQQSARRQAEHVLRVARQNAKTERCRQPDAANAGGQGPNDNCY